MPTLTLTCIFGKATLKVAGGAIDGSKGSYSTYGSYGSHCSYGSKGSDLEPSLCLELPRRESRTEINEIMNIDASSGLEVQLGSARLV